MEEKPAVTSQPDKPNAAKIGVVIIVIIIIILVAGIGVYESKTNQKVIVANETAMKASPSSRSATQLYKDGTYTAEGDYTVHIGPEHIEVTLTLKDDTITDATVISEAKDPMSIRMQGIFIANYKQYVIGKDIATLHLGRVSQSSLTPNGFNNAVAKIEAQAKV